MQSDVCLLLEGTYPYVAGGVSTWVYGLIKQMKDVSFSLLYLGARRPTVKKMHYEIPPNVVDFREIYLFDYHDRPVRTKPLDKRNFEIVKNFLSRAKKQDPALFEKLISISRDSSSIDIYDLAHSHEGWKILEKLYFMEPNKTSFIDYFWTWRFIYLPFFSLIDKNIPISRVYHSVSTGYAGVMGALATLLYNKPFILTEHGIYTRERKIEINKADWIYSEVAEEIKVAEDTKEFFKDWWTNFFAFFSRLAYRQADSIITLYEGNRIVEIEEGADPAKTSVIPNGINLNHLGDFKKEPPVGKYTIGFVGRVVPIKDVKTFIRACQIVCDKLDNVEVLIMGPTDEDEEYYQECVTLVEMQEMQDVIKFTGKVNVAEYYPKIDIVVLTSISEAQPLVILEGAACGLPSVAPEVGACRELLYGSSLDDKLLGSSGLITKVCNPESTANAIITILSDPELYARMSAVAKKRVMYYQMDDLIAHYYRIYLHYLERIKWPV